MGSKENIAELGRKTRFSKENQPANKGRKPKIYSQLKNVYKISHEEYRDMIMYLMQLSKDEIVALSKADDTPIWVVNMCRAFLSDCQRGSFYLLSDVVDRMWGKAEAKTKMDITSNGKEVGTQIVFSPTPLTERDIQEIKEIQSGGNKENSTDTGLSEA